MCFRSILPAIVPSAGGTEPREIGEQDRRTRLVKMASNEFVFAPLGGIGEIGMNLSIYGFGEQRRRQWIIIDCGVSFASEEHLPGVDLILPDIRYLLEQRKNILGLV